MSKIDGKPNWAPSSRVVGIPPRPFLYSPDQIAMILSVKLSTVMERYLFFEGRSVGVRKRGVMLARNIAPTPEDNPVWRVGEQELIRWMRYKGFRFYERVGLFSDAPNPEGIVPKNIMPDSPEEGIDPEPGEE
jgi:hypothetical protein